MPDASEAAVRAACERLVYESAARNDAMAWDRLGEVYAVDAVLVRPSGETLEGREAIVEAYAATPPGRLTRHVCTNVRIDLTGPDTAVGSTTVLLFIADPAEEGHAVRTSPGPAVGEFEDEFVRTADGWRISRRLASIAIKPRSG